jgi:MFS family permease
MNMRGLATPTGALVAAAGKRRRSASMRMTHRRYWVFFLLFVFSAIAYLDRVNMSVAGEAIAHEFGLSAIALGYLFSSFLWAYVLMMLPGGRLIDRWGPHVVASVATAVWSMAQMATGMVGSFSAMLMVRLGLGVGEAPFAPISYSSVRLWSPYTERGTAIAAISCGSTLGLALGAPAVAWLIETLSWRWSFIITGAVGFVWVAIWFPLVSTPEKTGWLPPAERDHILAGRDAGITPPSHSGVGYLGLIRSLRCGACSSRRAVSSIPAISISHGCRITCKPHGTCRS